MPFCRTQLNSVPTPVYGGRLKTREWKTRECPLWRSKMYLSIYNWPMCVNACSQSVSSSLRVFILPLEHFSKSVAFPLARLSSRFLV